MAGVLGRETQQYMLSDYQFLQDYEVVESGRCMKGSFVARIKNTDQKVRFVKRKYEQELLPRFKALYRLYKNGIILADNMFVLEECEQLYFYIIEAELDPENTRFNTLHHYLYHQDLTQQRRTDMLARIKILIDCLHQEGQSFAGLDPRKIILDDEGHIYLAPFDLDFELSMDSYSRAYYPPEVLRGISKDQHQISEFMMFKWDIWSFGCICLELLVFSSPCFLASSLARQIQLIKNADILIGLSGFQDCVKNIVKNSLAQEMSNRTISTSSLNATPPKSQLVLIPLRSVGQPILADAEVKDNIRELNIYQSSKGDCTLVLSLLSLSNIKVEKELRISIQLYKKFHFYVDFDDNNPKKYSLNRKITVKGSFEQIERYLSKPVVVQLREDEKIGIININLQTLILSQNGRRIWDQPIIGTFSSSMSSPFQAARLKIICSLTNPILIVEKNAVNNNNAQIPETSDLPKDTFSHIQQASTQSKVLKQKISNNVEVKDKQSGQQKFNQLFRSQKDLSKQKRSNIPSISEISSSLSAIFEQLRRKALPEEECTDSIQKQLSSLLQLQ